MKVTNIYICMVLRGKVKHILHICMSYVERKLNMYLTFVCDIYGKKGKNHATVNAYEG